MYYTKGQKIVINLVKLMIQTALVLELSTRLEMRYIQWPYTEQLIAAYPAFSTLPSEELDMLLAFRNAVKVALTVLPAYRNKARLLHIGGKAGGTSAEYTGQSAEVDRRVAIYEREGGI
jgi:Ser/Thr protein kinase RdoA (MazF antagonist)